MSGTTSPWTSSANKTIFTSQGEFMDPQNWNAQELFPLVREYLRRKGFKEVRLCCTLTIPLRLGRGIEFVVNNFWTLQYFPEVGVSELLSLMTDSKSPSPQNWDLSPVVAPHQGRSGMSRCLN